MEKLRIPWMWVRREKKGKAAGFQKMCCSFKGGEDPAVPKEIVGPWFVEGVIRKVSSNILIYKILEVNSRRSLREKAVF